tara:strand:+ start:329 stop:610 length:282 start_codon:yes stop_codon:yes gene_type:complete
MAAKKSNSWVDHVKKYKIDNNCSYADAMKLAKDSYVKTTKIKNDKPAIADEIVNDETPTPEETPVNEEVSTIEEPIRKKRVYKKRVPKSVKPE